MKTKRLFKYLCIKKKMVLKYVCGVIYMFSRVQHWIITSLNLFGDYERSLAPLVCLLFMHFATHTWNRLDWKEKMIYETFTYKSCYKRCNIVPRFKFSEKWTNNTLIYVTRKWFKNSWHFDFLEWISKFISYGRIFQKKLTVF